MSIKIGSIVFQCFEFNKTVDFWQNALNYQPRESATDDWVVLMDPKGNGPNLSFQKRDKKREKRNWIHLDLYTEEQEKEAERIIKCGAKKYPWRYPENADYVVLEDPDGNLFCVVKK